MYDYIIVGAGAAGCVLANRLSARSKTSVLLLEAGEDGEKRDVSVPLAWSTLQGSELDWQFDSDAQMGLNGRVVPQPRGKGLGGSSLINAMMFVMGHPADFDRWAALGNPGWDFASMRPHYETVREMMRPALVSHQVAVEKAFLEAAANAGYPMQDRFEEGKQEGFGRYLANIRKGKRYSAAEAYLKPAIYRSNLTIRTGVHVMNLLFKDDRIAGVRYFKDDEVREVKVNKEIILCAGACQSPQILLLSGLGPTEHLRRFGVPVRRHLPGVGENLQDHPLVLLPYRSKNVDTLIASRDLKKMLPFFFGRGPLTTNATAVGGFLRSGEGLTAPDLQFVFVPGLRPEWPGEGFGVAVELLTPDSRGRVMLKSTDALDPPRISPCYLEAPSDVERLLRGVKIAHQLTQVEPLSRHTVEPIVEIQDDFDDDAWVTLIRQLAETGYHPVGTCKMGPADDLQAVVDGQCRVHGLERVRVVDASIMPTIPRGNTHVPTMMIAERVAKMVLEDEG
ncbi:MAG: GMC family oxidoreductase N-terminal domain-containing protein [Ardenticatenaceae bacterium]|nr:GMC family oxidoreductase N-terminal domain-containing protein [Ardenticatenaceae bacterium]